MDLIYWVLIIFLFLIALVWYKEKQRKELFSKLLEEQWGKGVEEEYTSENLKAIKQLFVAKDNKRTDVDDITWNDLDMDAVFMVINNTQSSVGEEYLYYLLRNLCFDGKELEERNRLIQLFQNNRELRKKMQTIFIELGKLKEISIYQYLNKAQDVKIENIAKHYLHAIGLLVSFLLIFINPKVGVCGIIFFLAYNISVYYKVKAKIENYFTVISYSLKILAAAEELLKLKDGKEIQSYLDKLKIGKATFKKYKKGSFLVISGSNMSGGLFDMFLDYARILFHIDIIKFNQMIKEMHAHTKEFNEIYEVIGYLESMIAIASFREALNGRYSLPELVKTSGRVLEATNLFHPLIDEPVGNSIYTKKSILLTGSNASGKSTFLKTVAINAILSQTIYTSMSESYRGSYFKVLSSMALRDDIFSSESYYIVEIKSLKRILDQVEEEIPILCFVDEVLRGTNTLERIAASSEILFTLSRKNTICFAATHDIELTHILEKYFDNYHFQEEIQENDVIFDYKLHKGRAVSKNAIKLLRMMGYEENIVKKATDKANHFLESGDWEVFA